MSAARDRLAVLAIGGEQVVAVAHRLRRAHHRGLLADAEVEEAADLRLRVHLARALLEAADHHHLREHCLTGVLVRQRVLALRAVSSAVTGAFLPRYSGFARHRGLTLANSLGRLFEPVVAPEHLLADGNRGDTGYAAGDRLVRRSSQLLLHRSHLYSSEYRARVQLTRGGREQHVVHVAQIAPTRERLAEGRERECHCAAVDLLLGHANLIVGEGGHLGEVSDNEDLP